MEEKTLDLPGALWLGVLTGPDGPIAPTGPARPECLGVGAGVGGAGGAPLSGGSQAPGAHGQRASQTENQEHNQAFPEHPVPIGTAPQLRGKHKRPRSASLAQP